MSDTFITLKSDSYSMREISTVADQAVLPWQGSSNAEMVLQMDVECTAAIPFGKVSV